MASVRTSYEMVGTRVGQARQALMPDGKPRSSGADPVMAQGRLAELVGVHRVTIAKIETGQARVSREVLERLVEVLGRSREWLLGEPEQVDEFELARVKMASALESFSEAVDLLQRRIRDHDGAARVAT